MSQYVSSPETNLDILRANPYPGRLLVVGYYDDVAIIGYCIGGRSAGSQNRILDTQDNIRAPHRTIPAKELVILISQSMMLFEDSTTAL
ncbi:hypothetical protein IPL68_05820 [Candidatus Saccharibacteria bacterium]|nr:MAG: hypothetical protein IPL68_05820 [Candidatus Saccharibacteria bacterium]